MHFLAPVGYKNGCEMATEIKGFEILESVLKLNLAMPFCNNLKN